MTGPRFERVRADYSPRYPRTLSRDELRALVERDRAGRIARAAAAASVAFGASAAAQDAPDRERDVLRVLNAIGGDARSFWFPRTTFTSSDNAFGSPVVIPRVPISFGNSHNGVFDAGRARELARRLFEAYGVPVKRERDLRADDVAVRLDGYDPESKLGFKLRGEMPEANGMMASPVSEPAATDLTEEEHARLREDGLRIHVADLASYPVMDGDEFTPRIAYLAGIVAFLNDATPGPDIDLSSVLVFAQQRLVLPGLDPPPGVEIVESNELYRTISVETATVLPIRSDTFLRVEHAPAPKGRGQAEWVEIDAPISTTGAPTLLTLACTGPDGLPAKRRLVQDGSPEVHLEATANRLFAPARFDAARPFTMLLELEPGRYTLDRHLTIGLTR